MSQLGSLASELAEVSGFGPFFAIQTHAEDAVPQPPWRPMLELVDDPNVLRDRVFAIRTYLAAGRAPDHVPLRVAASVAQLGLVARLVSPALAAAVLTGRLPEISLGTAWWQPELGGAFPLSVGVGGQCEPDQVITGPVRQLVDAAARFSVSERVLWGNVASAINGAATMIGVARPELAARGHELAANLLELPPLAHTGTRGADGRFRRLSCCLIYRASPNDNRRNAICGDCVLMTG